MSISFTNLTTKEEFSAGGRDDWGKLCQLAENYGWKPAGTVNEDHPDWDGCYFSNDYQIITPEDGRNLAEALRKAAADLQADTRLKLWTTLTSAGINEAADFFESGNIMIC